MKTELHREQLSAAGFRFCVVVSRWNDELTSRLREGAVEALTEAGADADSVAIFHVPGAFELPLACLRLAQSSDYDAIIALGVIIRGDTPHFDFVANQASAGIMRAGMETGVPVLFGVITADNLEQAEARSGKNSDNKGHEAALSAIEMIKLIRALDELILQGRGDKALPNVV